MNPERMNPERMSTEQEILRIENLRVAFGKHVVLENLSMSLRRGEWVTLLGANGAGKTTLLRSILGHYRPVGGLIQIKGERLDSFSSRRLARTVALMPQFEQRDSELTAVELVSLGRIPHRGWLLPLRDEDHRIVREAMELCCIWEWRDRRVNQLSGGEWRRMLLARSMAQNASLLLLDEPTAGLDLKYQVECLKQVRYLVDHYGKSVFVSLHDLNQASAFSDKVLVLGNGGSLAFGVPRDVLTPEILGAAFGTEIRSHNPTDGSAPFILPNFGKRGSR